MKQPYSLFSALFHAVVKRSTVLLKPSLQNQNYLFIKLTFGYLLFLGLSTQLAFGGDVGKLSEKKEESKTSFSCPAPSAISINVSNVCLNSSYTFSATYNSLPADGSFSIFKMEGGVPVGTPQELTGGEFTATEVGEFQIRFNYNGWLCYFFSSFYVLAAPTAAPAILSVCDDDTDGYNDFNLTDADITVGGGQSDIYISYHQSQEDADNNIDALGSSFYSNSTTIYARVQFNSTGCYATSEVTLTVKPLPDVTCPGDFSVCFNADRVDLSALVSQAGGVFSGDGLYCPTKANGQGNTVVAADYFYPSCAGLGDHTIVYTVTDPITSCTNTCSFTISVHDLPEATISYDGSPYCAVGAAPVNFTGLVGGDYSSDAGLNFTANAGEIDLVSSTAGSYTITYVVNDGECTNTATASVTINEIPAISCPSDFEICYDADAIDLSIFVSPAGGQFQGAGILCGTKANTNGRLSSVSTYFYPSCAGSGEHIITYIYTDPSTNCTNSCSFVITVKELPPLFCPGDFSICLEADPRDLSSIVSQTGGIFSGDGIDCPVSTKANGQLKTSAATGFFYPSCAGVGPHTITYTYTDPVTSCSNTCSFIITVDPTPTAGILTAITTITCAAPFIHLIATGGDSYSWSDASTGFTLEVSAAGTYSVTATSDKGCKASASIEISEDITPPTVSAGIYGPVCIDGADIVLGGSPAGGVWDGIGVTAGQFDPSVGTHMLRYTFTGDNGCSAFADVTINVEPCTISNGTVYFDTNAGTIDGTPIASGYYISLFKSSNLTAIPDQVVPINGLGEFSFGSLLADTYTLVLGTSAAGSNVASYLFGKTASGEGLAGTTGDGNPNGIIKITLPSGTITPNAKMMDFPGISFGTKIDPFLPVRLVSFTGKPTVQGNELTWKTSSEQNFSHYEIEKSRDAKTFGTIAKVNGNGNTKENLNYTYLDINSGIQSGTMSPSNLSYESYYRLNMVDIDGSHEYSPIIFVKNELGRSIVGEFFPNPITGKEATIIINSTEFRDWIISSFDLAGKLIFTENKKLVIGDNKVIIKLHDQRSGVSIFRFENAEGIQYRKLIR